MESLPHNGYFVERRKMFVDAPFHNRQSYIPFNWQGSQETTEEFTRAKNKYQGEKKNVRQTYEQSVEERLNRRLHQVPYNITQKQRPHKRRSDEILTRELQMFNHPKVVENQSLREKQSSMQHHQKHEQNTLAGIQMSDSRMNSALKTIQVKDSPRTDRNQQHRVIQPLESITIKPQEHHKMDDSRYHRGIQEQQSFVYNPEIRHNLRDSYNMPAEHQNNYYQEPYRHSRVEHPSPVHDRYNSLNISRNPYPPGNLGKQFQQLYSGSKQQTYPFRNIKPDTLQNYLRSGTKADRKRAYYTNVKPSKY